MTIEMYLVGIFMTRYMFWCIDKSPNVPESILFTASLLWPLFYGTIFVISCIVSFENLFKKEE